MNNLGIGQHTALFGVVRGDEESNGEAGALLLW